MSDEAPRSGGNNNTLIIVLVIIAAICLGCGGLGALMFFGVKAGANAVLHEIEKTQEFRMDSISLEQAIETGIAEKKLTPDASGEVMAAALVAQGLATQDAVTDPWGQRYLIRKKAKGGWTIISMGPDGVEKTPDDLSSEDFSTAEDSSTPEGF